MTKTPLQRRRRLIGIGFVLAFAVTTGTIIYTGLNVRAPGTARTQPSEDTASPMTDSVVRGADRDASGDANRPDNGETAGEAGNPAPH